MILVTGGAGYIGSHTCTLLLEAGHDVLVLDNFCNSVPESLLRVEKITGKKLTFIKGDVCNSTDLNKAFSYPIDAVMHFAGLKSIGESTTTPLTYYHNNVTGTLQLLNAMQQNSIRRLVFSSSATVYGSPISVPVREDFPLSATNPYGQSKLMVEEILRDLIIAQPNWHIAILRYFNPVGAHSSGLIGEDPADIPNNLMPYISQVAIGKRNYLNVFGNDYPTHDGTGIRDYIHVMDLARGHLAALQALQDAPRLLTVNLGTGRGYSVLDIIEAFQQASGRPIPYRITTRRPGDIAACWADSTAAHQLLGWRAEKQLFDMCADSWQWQQRNPNGYRS